MARIKRDRRGLRVKIGICKECLIDRKRLNHYGVCEDCRRLALEALQKSYRNAVHNLNGDIGTKGRIEQLKAQGFSYRFQAEQLGEDITPADLSRLVAGIEPKSIRKRRALELPIERPAPVCEECGRVHVTKRCAEKRKKRTRRHRLVTQVPEDWKLAVQEAALAEGITVAEWLRLVVLEELDLDE